MSESEESFVYSVDVEIEAPVQPTEIGARVADAIEALFPTADIEVESDRVTATAHSVEQFRDRLFEQRILDTARGQFLQHRTSDGFSFDLKKQAAFRGLVNFSVGKPAELGDIHVEITVHEPGVESFIDYLAPRTQEGEPVTD